MSFRERSAWASLATIVLVFVPYFARIFRLFLGGRLTGSQIMAAFMGAVFFQILLSIVVQIVIGIATRQDQKDERDTAIESKSFKYAYNVLIYSCFVGVPIVIGHWFGFDPAAGPRLIGGTFIIQLLLLCFVLAEVTKYLTQGICYRRGS